MAYEPALCERYLALMSEGSLRLLSVLLYPGFP
jgi:hypothetical protein